MGSAPSAWLTNMIAGPSQSCGAGGKQTPSPGHAGAPVDVLSPELLPLVVDDDELDSASEVVAEVVVVVVEGSRLVVTPSVTPGPEELDPPLVSPTSATAGGEEKQPDSPTHSHTQCSNLMLEVLHNAQRKKPPAPRHMDGAEGLVEAACVLSGAT